MRGTWVGPLLQPLLQLQNALDLISISRKYLLLSVPTAALISH